MFAKTLRYVYNNTYKGKIQQQICFCFDKDIGEEELKDIANNFISGVPIYAVIDEDNLLDEKESPSDSPQKWLHLIKNNIYKIKGGEIE